MGNLLFSPNGRINSGEFIKGAIILIVLGLLLSVPEMMGMGDGIAIIMAIVSFLLIIPWIFIWIKRYHDAGKQGAMCLIPILVYIVGLIGLSLFLMADMFTLMFSEEALSDPEYAEAQIEALTKSKAVPLMIASTVWSAIVAFGFNALIKQQPEENQFGHPS